MFFAKKKLIFGAIAVFCILTFLFLILESSTLAGSFYEKGMNYFNNEDYSGAALSFKMATILDGKNGKYFANLGYAYHRQNNQRAEEAYLKALSLGYDEPLLYASMGLFYQEGKKDYDLAIQYYKKAVDFNPPQYTFAYDNLMNLLLILGRADEVVPVAEKLIQIYPENTIAFYYLGTSYDLSLHFEEAEKAFKKAIELEPGNPAWVAKSAGVLLNKGDVSQAIKEYEKALDLNPSYGAALCSLAYIFTFREINYEKAITYANKAIREEPESIWLPVCYYNLGYAYINSGNKENAKLAFENYLRNLKNSSEDGPYYEYVLDAENKIRELSQ